MCVYVHKGREYVKFLISVKYSLLGSIVHLFLSKIFYLFCQNNYNDLKGE